MSREIPGETLATSPEVACKAFALGRCNLGASCRFSHNAENESRGVRERSRSRSRIQSTQRLINREQVQETWHHGWNYPSPLALLKNAHGADGSRRWEAFIEDPSLRSFSYVLRREQTGLVDKELDGWWQALHPRHAGVRAGTWTQAIPSRYGQRKRQTAWYVRPPCTCSYAYGRTHQPAASDISFCRTIDEMTCRVARVLGIEPPNSVNLNFYEAGGGYAFHADDEALFDGLNRDACIISFSLAGDGDGDRWFEVKHKGPQGKKGKGVGKSDAPFAVKLRHGDIMTMEGSFQRYFLHSVWPGDRHLLTGSGRSALGERVNLSWRTIVKHARDCPLSQ